MAFQYLFVTERWMQRYELPNRWGTRPIAGKHGVHASVDGGLYSLMFTNSGAAKQFILTAKAALRFGLANTVAYCSIRANLEFRDYWSTCCTGFCVELGLGSGVVFLTC